LQLVPPGWLDEIDHCGCGRIGISNGSRLAVGIILIYASAVSMNASVM
jgi:hypothetical protein